MRSALAAASRARGRARPKEIRINTLIFLYSCLEEQGIRTGNNSDGRADHQRLWSSASPGRHARRARDRRGYGFLFCSYQGPALSTFGRSTAHSAALLIGASRWGSMGSGSFRGE